MENKTALITGAASGIGRNVAIAMAQAGYNVIINYVGDRQAALEVKQECEQLGVQVMTVMADVSDYTAVENMVKEITAVFPRIDVLVNNAGITKDNLLL